MIKEHYEHYDDLLRTDLAKSFSFFSLLIKMDTLDLELKNVEVHKKNLKRLALMLRSILNYLLLYHPLFDVNVEFEQQLEKYEKHDICNIINEFVTDCKNLT